MEVQFTELCFHGCKWYVISSSDGKVRAKSVKHIFFSKWTKAYKKTVRRSTGPDPLVDRSLINEPMSKAKGLIHYFRSIGLFRSTIFPLCFVFPFLFYNLLYKPIYVCFVRELVFIDSFSF